MVLTIGADGTLWAQLAGLGWEVDILLAVFIFPLSVFPVTTSAIAAEIARAIT